MHTRPRPSNPSSRFLFLVLVASALAILAVGCASDDPADSDATDLRDTATDLGDTTADMGDTNPTDTSDLRDAVADTPDGNTSTFDTCPLGDARYGNPSGIFEDHRLRFANTTENIRVELARTYVSVGVGESAIYELAGLAVDRGDGTEACVTNAAELDYENTHHNWLDVAFAQTPEMRYQLDIFYLVVPDMQGRMGDLFEVSGLDNMGNVVWGPFELTLANPM